MSERKSVCFISYSHEDVDRNTLAYIKKLLERYSDGYYKVLLDSDLKYGEDFTDFMQLLDHFVDAVLILMTPSYKKKVLNRQGGVYTEYSKIIHRYNQIQAEKRRGKKSGEIEGYFVLYPILFSGTFVDAVPDEIANIKYLDLRKLRVIKGTRGGLRISPQVEKRYAPEILKIASGLKVISVVKSKSYANLYQSYFPRLFLELKADWSNDRDSLHNYPETLFVQTIPYKKVESQAAYFIIGRKGSGKTTIRDLLALRQRNKYIAHISIVADEFNLLALYNLFEPRRVKSDINQIFNRLSCFRLAWQAFLMMCSMDDLLSIRKTKQLTPYQKRQLKPIHDFFQELKSAWAVTDFQNKNACFVYCFNQVIEFIDDCISNARSEDAYFYSDLIARFTPRRFMTYVFGDDVIKAYFRILNSIRKKFLISLDGFDSAYDVFRRESLHIADELDGRADFEIDWLRALVQLVIEMSHGGDTNLLFAKSDFCITVPHDKFFEVSTSERDSYKYQNRFQYLRWSGIELTILLRKRLEELTQFSTDKSRSPENRLEQIMRERFSHIPWAITFTFNNRQYQMPVFLYVLRHTFWRPRDVLLLYAKLLTVGEALRKKGKEMDAETIRHVVKLGAEDIIKSEFINEFDTTVINIKDILASFTWKRQLLTYDEVTEILSTVRFDFASRSMHFDKLDDKIRFLYQVGFLGIYADKHMQSRLGLKSSHAFYFNEGERPLRTIGAKSYGGYKFIIHPIFSEYLDIDTSGNELILNYSWLCLHELEAILSL